MSVTFHIGQKTKELETCIICFDPIQSNQINAFHEADPFHETAEKIKHTICIPCFQKFLNTCKKDEIKPRCPLEKDLIENLLIDPPLQSKKRYQKLQTIITESKNWEDDEDITSQALIELVESFVSLSRTLATADRQVRLDTEFRQENDLLYGSLTIRIREVPEEHRGFWGTIRSFFGL